MDMNENSIEATREDALEAFRAGAWDETPVLVGLWNDWACDQSEGEHEGNEPYVTADGEYFPVPLADDCESLLSAIRGCDPYGGFDASDFFEEVLEKREGFVEEFFHRAVTLCGYARRMQEVLRAEGFDCNVYYAAEDPDEKKPYLQEAAELYRPVFESGKHFLVCEELSFPAHGCESCADFEEAFRRMLEGAGVCK